MDNLMEKLRILTDAAKYDVACTSSGTSRNGNGKTMGIRFHAEYVIHFLLMADACHFLRFC